MKRSLAMTSAALLLMLLGALFHPGRLAAEPPPDPSDLINTLLGGLLGFNEMTGPELQKEVAEVGGVPFRSEVPLDYISRTDLARYLKDVLDSEYPEERARADQRTLVAFSLLEPGVDLRPLRARLLEENVAGFYDERPGKKRLYAVSADRRLTPANQLILAHELRHALQDQYANVHDALPDSVSDFDDRRLAFLSLLEGDATLVMERFLRRRLPLVGDSDADPDFGALSVPGGALPGTPAVLQDQLVLPYLVGRDFARAVWKQGGWDALRKAWNSPPASTEQVLHPEKYFSSEAPRPVEVACDVRGRVINEGVLGEMLTRTLLGEGSESAAAGWGGDRFRTWDVSGKTLLAWRSVWDTPADAREFLDRARSRFGTQAKSRGERSGFTVFESGAWRFALGEDGAGVLLVSSDEAGLFEAALRSCRAPR